MLKIVMAQLFQGLWPPYKITYFARLPNYKTVDVSFYKQLTWLFND